MDRLEEYDIECMLINDNQAQEDELIKEYERNSMDRLISEFEVIRAIEKYVDNIFTKNMGDLVKDIKTIPSAEPYKGMTNGEVIKTVFPNIPRTLEWHIQNVTDDDWWNSPYEPQESEG